MLTGSLAFAALFLHFKKPVMIVEGKMQYLFDEKGRRFLDVSPHAWALSTHMRVCVHARRLALPSPAVSLLTFLPTCLPPQAFAGIVTVSVGHCHPKVVEAVNEQSKLLQHTTTIYLNHQIAEYAKELANRMPGDLKASPGGRQLTAGRGLVASREKGRR